MHSYLLTGLRMGPLVKVLRQRGVTPTPRNLARLLFVVQNAFWASFHTWRERKLYGREEKSYPVPDDPIIIIGHWRTGSTYLHQLLSQDPAMVAPSLFQVTFPDCFRSAERYFRPIMGLMVRNRPMDNVKMGFDDPQEDEFAILKLTQDSPLLDVVFPKSEGYFIGQYEDFNPRSENREMWKEKMLDFCARVRRDSGRTLILKNPAHSLRIPFLLEVFPNARFIHICRHPYKVAASSMHLWKVMAMDNQLKGDLRVPDLQEVVQGMVKFQQVIERESIRLSEQQFCEIKYEELEKDPEGEIARLYRQLGLEFTGEFRTRIGAFRESVKDFRKNSYTFDAKEKDTVYHAMKDFFKKYDYTR